MQLDAEISAIVVGGASGMGEATVRALRARQVRVGIVDKNDHNGNVVAAETGALFVSADVTDEDAVSRAFRTIRGDYGQERILVVTTGGGSLGHTARRDATDGVIHRHDFQRFGQIVALNLNGTFLCASIAAAGMMTLEPSADGDRGVILMTSSTASQDAPAATVAYVAAKSAINGMTLAMARDLAAEAIRVNTILPGTFDTPLIRAVPDEYKVAMRSWNLHPKRFGRPAEYAALALQVIENAYMNAALIRLDGGARV